MAALALYAHRWIETGVGLDPPPASWARRRLGRGAATFASAGSATIADRLASIGRDSALGTVGLRACTLIPETRSTLPISRCWCSTCCSRACRRSWNPDAGIPAIGLMFAAWTRRRGGRRWALRGRHRHRRDDQAVGAACRAGCHRVSRPIRLGPARDLSPRPRSRWRYIAATAVVVSWAILDAWSPIHPDQQPRRRAARAGRIRGRWSRACPRSGSSTGDWWSYNRLPMVDTGLLGVLAVCGVLGSPAQAGPAPRVRRLQRRRRGRRSPRRPSARNIYDDVGGQQRLQATARALGSPR